VILPIYLAAESLHFTQRHFTRQHEQAAAIAIATTLPSDGDFIYVFYARF
jgi:hypothetical protein